MERERKKPKKKIFVSSIHIFNSYQIFFFFLLFFSFLVKEFSPFIRLYFFRFKLLSPDGPFLIFIFSFSHLLFHAFISLAFFCFFALFFFLFRDLFCLFFLFNAIFRFRFSFFDFKAFCQIFFVDFFFQILKISKESISFAYVTYI